jgi:hypothetical protein
MTRFEAIGERARWRVAYDLFVAASVGDIITYEALAEAMGLDPVKGRHAAQMAVRGAIPRLEEDFSRTVDVVPNKGYVIVIADEHLRLAKQHMNKAGRSVVRARSKVDHTDLNQISPEGRVMFAAFRDFVRGVDAKLAEMGQGQREHAERLARIEQRLGIQPPGTVDGEVVDP